MTQSDETPRQMADPLHFEVVQQDNGLFALTYGGEVLLTVNGDFPVCNSARPLLEHMASEFDGQGSVEIQERRIVEPKFFGSYALFGIQKVFIEPGKDDLSLSFTDCLLRDPALHEVPGHERTEQAARMLPVDKWLKDHNKPLRNLAAAMPYLLGEEEDLDAEQALADARNSEDVAYVHKQYLSLAPEQRAVVMMLHTLHEGPVLFPMALVLEKCNSSEYAQGVMASHAILSGTFADVDDKEHRDYFNGLRDDARTGLEYIKLYQSTPLKKLRDLIKSGESTHLEFKSTLRMNLHTKQNDVAMTQACLKTIAAFINTEGGTLLIGVSDSGEISGIEKDGFPNTDKFSLHLWNHLKQALGDGCSAYINTDIMEDHNASVSVCKVECKKSDEPVFCKEKGGGEQFYVRTGPGTTSLPASEQYAYIQKRFGDQSQDRKQ